MALAFIAPGQGAQFIGMGLELAESYPQSRLVYEEVDDALGENCLLYTSDAADE